VIGTQNPFQVRSPPHGIVFVVATMDTEKVDGVGCTVVCAASCRAGCVAMARFPAAPGVEAHDRAVIPQPGIEIRERTDRPHPGDGSNTGPPQRVLPGEAADLLDSSPGINVARGGVLISWAMTSSLERVVAAHQA
jgi:hypothetical protein